MGSEDQVMELMVLLDTGLNQANKIEEKLNEYELKLQVGVFSFRHLVLVISSSQL
jgi:hypothetical protein